MPPSSPHFLVRVFFHSSSCCPPPHIPLNTTHSGCAALPTRLCRILVPPHHDPFGCFEDPRYHFPAFFAAGYHNAVSTPNTKGASSVDTLVAQNSLRTSIMHLCQVLNCLPSLQVLPTSHCPDHYPTGCAAVPRPPPRRAAVNGWSFRCSCNCHLESLRVREGGVVSTNSALEAND